MCSGNQNKASLHIQGKEGQANVKYWGCGTILDKTAKNTSEKIQNHTSKQKILNKVMQRALVDFKKIGQFKAILHPF